MNLLKAPLTDKDFVNNLIPQKYPFVMVDKLLYFSENKVVSGFSISKDNIFSFQSLFTASGLIENMAQTVALFTGYQYFLKKEKAPTGYIGAIKKVEIVEFPKTGDELVTTVNILHEIMGVTLVNSQVACNGKIIASSEMKTVLA
jgi:3-hydroxymyristoyl/3-hydroxydecanoyl-(acyl carrier protein) dehydratase